MKIKKYEPNAWVLLVIVAWLLLIVSIIVWK